MKNIIIVALALLCLNACNTKNDYISIQSCEYFNDNSFDEVIQLKSTVFDTTVIQNPARIALNDTILFSLNTSYGSDTLVRCFSTVNKHYLGGIGIRGNGPEEILSASNVCFSVDSSQFWVFDVTKQTWNHANMSIFNNMNSTNNWDVFNLRNPNLPGIDNLYWIKNGFVGNSWFKYEERFFIFNPDGTVRKPIINNNLKFTNDLSDAILADMFFTHLTITPNHSNIVLAGRYLDLIEIYDNHGNILKMIKGPEKGFDFVFDRERSSARSVLVKSPDSKRAYLAVKATTEKIYALYSGKAKKDKEHYSYSKCLYVFSMDGKCLKKYILDVPIIDFSIDEKNNKLYAVSINSELVYFNI